MLGIDPPIVIAHRGASGYRPEHTLAAYAVAIDMGADYIEPDLVMTKDGVLVARHENELSGTTDVAQRHEFAARRTRKTIDGQEVDGWFTEDFTLAELKTLRARERIPRLRPDNTRFEGLFEIPSFGDILALVDRANGRLQAGPAGKAKGRLVGVYPETKHPSYFRSIGLAMEEPLVALLNGMPARTRKRVFIQSFEVANLRRLRRLSDYPLVQLLNDTGAPYDFVAAGDGRTYADLAKPRGLAEIARHADGIGVDKNRIIPRSGGLLGSRPTRLIMDAHAAGLAVHGWTFRAENAFLPDAFRGPGGEAELGDLAGEVTAFLLRGLDGLFADQPDIGVRARDAFLNG